VRPEAGLHNRRDRYHRDRSPDQRGRSWTSRPRPVEDGLTGDGGARDRRSRPRRSGSTRSTRRSTSAFDRGLVVRNATDWVVELFKHRPKPWVATLQIEQQDLIAGIEDNVHELVRQIVEAVAANGTEPVRCLFVGFTDKGDDIKAELKLKAMSREDTERAVLFFHRARGQHVMVSLASAGEFHTEPARDQSEEDQRGFGFEAGGAEHGEDVDLEAAAIPAGGKPPLPEDTTEVVHTGDSLVIASHGICEARVNLKTGMLEALPAGLEWGTGILDIREASPAELAGERERVADFDEAGDTLAKVKRLYDVAPLDVHPDDIAALKAAGMIPADALG
jgi:hypothetical protein